MSVPEMAIAAILWAGLIMIVVASALVAPLVAGALKAHEAVKRKRRTIL